MPNITGTFNDSASALASGQSGEIRSTSQRALHVNLRDPSGAYVAPGGGTTDGTTFTAGSSTFNPVGGVFDDGVAAISSGKSGEVRLTTNRAAHVNIRDHLGNEATLTGNSLNVNVTNGAAGGTSLADKAAFTVGTTAGTPAFGLARTDQPDLVADATAVAVATTLRRGLHVNIRANDGTQLIGQKTMAGSIPVVIASDQSAYPVSQSGSNWSMNVAQINGVTPLMGNGVTGTGSLRVTVASDNTAFAVNATCTNAGTFAVQDSQVIVDNAAFTDGTSKVFMNGYVFDEVAGTALTENDAAAARIDSKRAQVFVIEDETTRGTRVSVKAASTSAVATDKSLVVQINPQQTPPVSISQINGVAALAGNGVTGTGSLRVTIASDNTAFSVNATCTGNVAAAASDSGNPVKVGGVYLSAPGTALTTGQRSNELADAQGRVCATAAPVAWVTTQATTITSSTTETTIVTAGGANVFLDLVFLMITNSSATACSVTIKDGTAGTTRMIVDIAANGGAVIPIPSPGHPQSGANANWTATCGTSVASIHITAICHQRK